MDGESDLVLGLAASALSGLSSAYAGAAAAFKCHNCQTPLHDRRWLAYMQHTSQGRACARIAAMVLRWQQQHMAVGAFTPLCCKCRCFATKLHESLARRGVLREVCEREVGPDTVDPQPPAVHLWRATFTGIHLPEGWKVKHSWLLSADVHAFTCKDV